MQFKSTALVSLLVFVTAAIAAPVPAPLVDDVEARGPPFQADW